MEEIYGSKSWNKIFNEQENRLEKPHDYINLITDALKEKFGIGARVLDIGYGCGRHLEYFLKQGFKVSGFDFSDNAEEHVRKRFSNLDINKIDLRKINMFQTPWPYEPYSFDGAISIGVINHSNFKDFLKIINEIYRVLSKRGLLFCTLLSKENYKYNKGKRLDDYTFLMDSGVEKGISHCFFDRKDLLEIFNKKYNIKKIKLIHGETFEKDRFQVKNFLDHWLVFVQKK